MRQLKLLSFILLLTLLHGCAKEKDFPEAQRYPILRTLKVTPDSTGAFVKGEIVSLGNEPVTEYGFEYTAINNDKSIIKKVVGTSAVTGEFETRLTHGLVKGYNYRIQAYAKHGQNTTYGTALAFKSLNTAAPVIHSFSPKAAEDNSTVTIYGQNFSNDRSLVKVSIGETQAYVVSAHPDSITIITPRVTYSGTFPITVTAHGEQTTAKEEFEIIGPQITHISPDKGMPGGELSIYGKNLSYSGWGPYVNIGGKSATIVSVTDTEIKVKVPVITPDLYDKALTVSVNRGNKTAVLAYSYTMESGFMAASVKPTSVPATTAHIPSFISGGKAYFFAYDRMISYEVETAVWRNEGAFPGQARNGSALHKVGDKVYLIGGNYQYYTIFMSVWEYDISSKSWLQKKGLTFGVSDASSFTHDGYIYFFGGRNTNSNTTLWRYDPATEEVKALNPFRNNYNGSGFVINGKAYTVVGNATWLYNAQQDSWSQVAVMPEESTLNGPFRVFTHQGTGYAISAKGDKALLRFSEEQKKWERVAVYPGCVSSEQYSGFSYGDKLYVGSFGSCSSTLYYYQNR
ncbi:IPT/TIG domain-containing protein [Pontibacter sp. FD36]|uniref:IPT/TIG domain-containing protein n=1 Tax=Pontibacter sp. FD36 TaxID=2789860 RepID=UPI0018AA9843|nr:IPT/TIG domain-containing protein [Pontibacter sp. FD36]MBF8961794.1 IPT/TIG domain-containing protein [Pontibacter sp. FD36]